MGYISHSSMDVAWKKVGAMSADRIRSMQKRHQKAQKALAKFACSKLLDLREDSAGVGIYVFHVIVEAFSSVSPKPKSVRRPAINRVWELPMSELDSEVRAFEPHASQYLEEALSEEDDVVLTKEEQAHCSQVLQAAIICLHQACGNRRIPNTHNL